MGWGGGHKKEEEGKGAHKSPPSSEEAEGRDGHGGRAWVGSAQRNRTWDLGAAPLSSN